MVRPGGTGEAFMKWIAIIVLVLTAAWGCKQQTPPPAAKPGSTAQATPQYDTDPVTVARAFTVKLAAGNVDAAVDDHVDAEEMFHRTFPDRTNTPEVTVGGRH